MMSRFVDHIAGASETIIVTMTINPGTISLEGASTELTLKKTRSACSDADDYSKTGTIDTVAKTLTFFIEKGETANLDPGDYEYRIWVETANQRRCPVRGRWKISCG